MDQQQWLTCVEPVLMVNYLRDIEASERKLMDFAIACIEVSGCLAYSETTIRDNWHMDRTSLHPGILGHMLDCCAGYESEQTNRQKCALLRDIFGNPFRLWCSESDRKWADKDSVEADERVTRIYGDRVLKDSWLCWNDRTIPKIAQRIYDGNRWEDMPILADALEEAGCTNEEILNHCREGVGDECPQCDGTGQRGHCKRCRCSWNKREMGCVDCGGDLVLKTCQTCDGRGRPLVTHVRGCWVVDLLLRSEG